MILVSIGNMSKCLKGAVHGKVQGVFFRVEAQKKARKLDLTGWIRNNEDKSVEFMVQGEESALNLFLEWLRDGSEMATVDSITSQSVEEQDFGEFEIK